jgi:hypothetical protein
MDFSLYTEVEAADVQYLSWFRIRFIAEIIVLVGKTVFSQPQISLEDSARLNRFSIISISWPIFYRARSSALVQTPNLEDQATTGIRIHAPSHRVVEDGRGTFILPYPSSRIIYIRGSYIDLLSFSWRCLVCRRHEYCEPANLIGIKDLLCVRLGSSHQIAYVFRLHLSIDTLLQTSD